MKNFEKAKSQALKLKKRFKKEIYEINLMLFWISIYSKNDNGAINYMKELAKISGEDSFENLKLMILKNEKIKDYYIKAISLSAPYRAYLLKNLKNLDPNFPPAYYYSFIFER